MIKRSTVKLVDSAAPSAGTVTKALGVPRWATKATLIVEGTTAAASTVDAKVQAGTPDGTSTAYVDTGVAIDQIAASATAVGRFASWGGQAALAGTSFDVFTAPLSAYQRLSYTLAGTVTNLKIWVEFEGEVA